MVETLFVEKGAEFSPDRIYRYLLWRIWEPTFPLINWLMLNPSTADENVEDPTISKCIKFSKMWGYGGVYITNIFAFRATDPEDMKLANYPTGVDNDWAIYKTAVLCEKTIAAWGNHGSFMRRSAYVRTFIGESDLLVGKLHCLKLNKTGEPQHPLYLPFSSKPFPLPGKI